jgi:hypothetical protein
MLKSNNDENLKFLIPANEKFIEYFEEFMSNDFKTNIQIKNKANTARQYAEGIMNLLLYKSKIEPYLSENEKNRFADLKKRNMTKCIKVLEEHYSPEVAEKFNYIFKNAGNAGSHFNGEVTIEELQKQRELLKHIVEDIFVQYFLDETHIFGTENIFTIFSMLTLESRIYILEKIYENYQNSSVVDRLSLAYFKNNQLQKAIEFLMESYSKEEINREFYGHQILKFSAMQEKLTEVQKINVDNIKNGFTVMKQATNGLSVVGYSSNKNSFDIKKSVENFKSWFDSSKEQYPEFTNMFLSLMLFDDRECEENSFDGME